MRARAPVPKEKTAPPAPPSIGSSQIRVQALELVIRAVQLIPGWNVKTAAELLVQAELVETWIRGGKA